LIQNVLGVFIDAKFTWKSLLAESNGLSHAEIDQACRDAIKQAILTDKQKVNVSLLQQMLKERQGAHSGQKE